MNKKRIIKMEPTLNDIEPWLVRNDGIKITEFPEIKVGDIIKSSTLNDICSYYSDCVPGKEYTIRNYKDFIKAVNYYSIVENEFQRQKYYISIIDAWDFFKNDMACIIEIIQGTDPTKKRNKLFEELGIRY